MAAFWKRPNSALEPPSWMPTNNKAEILNLMDSVGSFWVRPPHVSQSAVHGSSSFDGGPSSSDLTASRTDWLTQQAGWWLAFPSRPSVVSLPAAPWGSSTPDRSDAAGDRREVQSLATIGPTCIDHQEIGPVRVFPKFVLESFVSQDAWASRS